MRTRPRQEKRRVSRTAISYCLVAWGQGADCGIQNIEAHVLGVYTTSAEARDAMAHDWLREKHEFAEELDVVLEGVLEDDRAHLYGGEQGYYYTWEVQRTPRRPRAPPGLYQREVAEIERAELETEIGKLGIVPLDLVPICAEYVV